MTQSLTNQLLVAMPQLKNTSFDQSVIYVCQDDAQGTMGLVVNQAIDETLRKIFIELDIDHHQTDHDILHKPIHIGGPVKRDNIFILHTPISYKTYESTMVLSEHLHITQSIDILEDIARNFGPAEFMVFAGCSSWSKQQLLSEIKNNDWLTLNSSAKLLFQSDNAIKWHECLKNLGIDQPAFLSEQQGHA